MQGKAFREMRVELMNCAVDYTDNMMVTVTNSTHQKPREDAQEMVCFKQGRRSVQECVGRGQKSVRWGENEV